MPYPASARTQPKRTPAVLTLLISSMAISGLVRATCRLAGTFAFAIRSGFEVQFSGRNKRRPIITGTSLDASVTKTSV